LLRLTIIHTAAAMAPHGLDTEFRARYGPSRWSPRFRQKSLIVNRASRSSWTLFNLTRSVPRSFYITNILVGSIVAVSCTTAVSDPESSPPFSHFPFLTVTPPSPPSRSLHTISNRLSSFSSLASLLWTPTRSTAHPKPRSTPFHSEEVCPHARMRNPLLLYLVLR
jgi:hypothetical protein